MTQFKREDRYLVIKRSDIPHLSKNDQQRLDQIAARIDLSREVRGREPIECVVVENDWPESEVVWRLIEDRVAATGETK